MKGIVYAFLILSLISCYADSQKEATAVVRIVTLDPGHFHAALIQKIMYGGVDSLVHVYAPSGDDVMLHLDRIKAYNERTENPTHWTSKVFIGKDFFKKMLDEKAGNVVVLAGNNQKKTEYILKSLESGLNVFADKPMAINSQNFELLKKAFEVAKSKKLLLYDIMTERFEITSILQRELSMIPEVFGTLQEGTPENPAVAMESVHCFYKYVSGKVLTRPSWFFDMSQEGEGLVDVATHLVDLVQWECFPDQIIDYTKDIQVLNVRHWPTNITLSEFKTITKQGSFPQYLRKDVLNDSILQVYSNGELNYKLRGICVKVSVKWNYKSSDGGGDTHYSIMRGTKADLLIVQGVEQQFKPTLYIVPKSNNSSYVKTLNKQIAKLQSQYPGIELKKGKQGLDVFIPEKYREGHEAHFAKVTKNYLEYFKGKEMPAWEIPNMLAKYYTTTKALEMVGK